MVGRQAYRARTEPRRAKPATGQRIAWGRLPWVTLLAAIGAGAAVAIVYLAASGLGYISSTVVLPSPMGKSSLTVEVVAITAALATAWAAVAFALVGLFARRPVRTFRIVATVALLISLLLPATVPGPPAPMRLSMALMHLVVWAVSVGLLTTLGRRGRAA